MARRAIGGEEAVASLIVPGVFMVSLTYCYHGGTPHHPPAGGLQKELEARTADNLTPIAIRGTRHPRNRSSGFGD